MMPQPLSPPRPIIVVRKRAAHVAHHGGAWKVAYADFVTAMMALFIVLWLMNSSDHMRKAIAGYFNDPRGSTTTIGTDRAGAGDAIALSRNDLRDLKARLEQQVTSNPALVKLKQQIEITITPEGLRIELIESRDGTFFETGSATLNENGRTTLALLAHQLGQVPNFISVEGHTDARAYADVNGYGNWELSADRATRRAGSWSTPACAAVRSRRCAASPTDNSACPVTRSIRRTAASPSSCTTSPRTPCSPRRPTMKTPRR